MKILVCQTNSRTMRMERLIESLSEAEVQRASTLSNPKTREQFLVGRGIARALLSRMTALPPRQFAITMTGGKPEVTNVTSAHFSITKSSDTVAVAAGPVPIGLDLEELRPHPLDVDVQADFFHANERARVNARNGQARISEFFRIWTQKEAYAKAIGQGFSVDFKQICVPESEGEIAAFGETKSAIDWYSKLLKPAPGYCLALVSPLKEPEIEYVDVPNQAA